MELRVKKLHPDAVVPTYAHDGDAGMDLYALEDAVLAPSARLQCRTGIAIAIPNGYVGLVWDKSGLSHRSGIKTLGGVMDSGYRGEYLIGLINLSSEGFHIVKGQKIAQLLIQKIERADIDEVADLDDTHRGERGFGSSGT